MSSGPERIHAFDALRAVMMTLGVVLHSAISYCVREQTDMWQLKDPNTTHLAMDILVGYMHIFRMPIFFVVAGFFGALLCYQRSPLDMLMNRVKRVLWPFLVFLVLLWPVNGASYAYTRYAFTGVIDAQVAAPLHIGLLIPQSAFHLWFLEYLMLISSAFFVLAVQIKMLPQTSMVISQSTKRLFSHNVLRVPMLAVAVLGVLYVIGREWVSTPTDLTPDCGVLLFYSVFYSFGWILFICKKDLSSFKKNDLVLCGISLLLFGATFVFESSVSPLTLKVLNSLTVSLCVFGVTGVFVRYFSRPSPVMRYVSDASYWVYIVHLTYTILGAGILADQSWSPIVKFLLITTVTLLISFSTYHFWVRSTLIGKFLNGRVYPISKSDLPRIVVPES